MLGQIIAADSMSAEQNYAGESTEADAANDAWYLAYTEPRQEILALGNLRQQGFQTYLPLYKTIKKRTSKSAMDTATAQPLIVHEPMFPRYLFFKPSSNRQSISVVRSTRGVNSIVRFGSLFALVQPQVLAAIQEQEQLRNGLDPKSMDALKPGRHVRINDAGMEGLEGLVHSTSSKRIIVLMEILGHQTRIKVSRSAVEPI
jgi:transcriptional antiterminator RfaH